MKNTYHHFEQSQSDRQWHWSLSHGLIIGLIAILLTACQGPIPKHADEQATLIIPSTEYTEEIEDFAAIQQSPQNPSIKPSQQDIQRVSAQAKEEARKSHDLWQRVRADFRLLGNYHPRVEHEIKRLQRNPAALNLLLSRSKPYLYHIITQIEAHDLPGEIALLPAVESGFRPFAYSRLGAAGLWQFMPATGRMLGLKQNWWYDGRRNVTASTRAAIEYLTRLNKRFDGNWLYALASYNAGAGNVNRAIRKALKNGQPTDYWSLALPAETRDYIPRLLALAEIVYNPTQYGVVLPTIKNTPYFAVTKNTQKVDLGVAAKLAQTPLQDFLNINPAFKQGITHPASSKQLLLPIHKQTRFKKALAALPKHKRLRWHQHKIRPGESLIKIARRYGLPVKTIRRANNLSSNRIRSGSKLLIPLKKSAALAAVRKKATKTKVRYNVRRGDSLYAIARKFQVKVADLKRWNNVNRHLRPGQKLTVYVNST